jgi:hypothetical protein
MKTFYFSVVMISAFFMAFMTRDELFVFTPGLACVILVFWLYRTLRLSDQKIPVFDVGMFCAIVTLIYSVYPLLNYWVGEFDFGVFGDARLTAYKPSATEVGFFHLRHVLYLSLFVLFYTIFRGTGVIEAGRIDKPSRGTTQVVITAFIFLTGYFLALQMVTGLNFNHGYDSDAVGGKLEVVASAPLVLVQISGKLAGILTVFKLALLYIVINRCNQRKWFIILFVWIAAEVILMMAIKGARAGTFLFILAAILLYHRIIKEFSMRFLISSGILFFVFFMFLGLYRSFDDISSMRLEYVQAGVGYLSGTNNEFQSMLGTAYDVYQRKIAGAAIPWYLYINDIIGILPPQQFLPFEKVDASEWYLKELGLSGTGQGYMWGVITQSIIGFDWMEIALRGSLLGFILARVHRWYVKNQSSFFATILYLYLILNCYYTFRNTTGSIFNFIVWEFLPFYFIIILGITIGRSSGSNQTRLVVA